MSSGTSRLVVVPLTFKAGMGIPFLSE
jgi:hypothetical protein